MWARARSLPDLIEIVVVADLDRVGQRVAHGFAVDIVENSVRGSQLSMLACCLLPFLLRESLQDLVSCNAGVGYESSKLPVVEVGCRGDVYIESDVALNGRTCSLIAMAFPKPAVLFPMHHRTYHDQSFTGM